LSTHFAKGAIFENYVLADLMKLRYNLGLPANLYYWKDNHNKEIDAIIETGNGVVAIEIKSALTYSSSFFDNIQYWRGLDKSNQQAYVIYSGDKNFNTVNGKLVAWNKLAGVNKEIIA